MIRGYLEKMKGTTVSPPRVGLLEVGLSWMGAFLGIGLVAFIHYGLLKDTDAVMLIGSFGASAVLVYGAVKSPLAQPRNLIGGHMVSAVVGVLAQLVFAPWPWLASAVAVATAIAVMHLTKTLHPPGGATALIAVIGSDRIHALGFLYVLVPVGLGAAIMLAVALVFNNLPGTRRYPEFWV